MDVADMYMLGHAPIGDAGARSHYHYVRPLVHITPDSLTYSVPLFLKQQCDRTLGDAQRCAGLFASAKRPFMLQNVGGAITRAMVVIALDVKVILSPPCIFH